MTPRKTTALFVAASMLALGPVQARAAHAKHHAHVVHKKAAGPAAAKGKVAVQAPAVVIVSKPPAEARDFDYQTRIQEAQALVAKQPVLPGDIQVDGAGRL